MNYQASSKLRQYGKGTRPKEKAIGVLLPFNGNAQLVDIKKGYTQLPVMDVKPFQQSYSTEEQAISNLVNLLLTRRGERLMQPGFGSPIPDFVFEPNSISNRRDLEIEVEDVINYWTPYIKVKSIKIVSEGDTTVFESTAEHNVLVKIEFSVLEEGANREITLLVSGNAFNLTVN